MFGDDVMLNPAGTRLRMHRATALTHAILMKVPGKALGGADDRLTQSGTRLLVDPRACVMLKALGVSTC